MGGQACIFYGAAEFSRDLDLLVLADPDNLHRLRVALEQLQAVSIAVPPFDAEYLARGHAIHFRCARQDVDRLRIDIMSNLRGVDNFERLWQRRSTLLSEDLEVDLMGLEDLVLAKKTQRNKDWPMIQRLVERHYTENHLSASDQMVMFWLRELRTPELLREVITKYPGLATAASATRPALNEPLEQSLRTEEDLERMSDREYWKPLRAELEQMRFKQKSPAPE